jgi:GntR family transcriptional regulator / MocR family aminotransferase
MAVQWSGLSPELLIALDRGRGADPLRSQLEQRLREAIRSGRLRAGERLPSSRELARALGTSRGLIQECYAQLQAEGYLSTRIGSATTVAERASGAGMAEAVDGGRAAGATGGGAAGRGAAGGGGGIGGGVAAGAGRARLLADFRSGVPDLGSFPRGDWMWAQREACRTVPSEALDYGDPRGSPLLREVLAAYLRRVRAAAADPDQMVICTGFAQGLGLALRALARAGTRRVAFEDPGDDATQVAAWAGVEVVRVPVDAGGIDVGRLAATGARAVILSPAHQWPTGVVLAAERRHALVAWAARADAVIIEDDYDAEFRYDREPVGALQGLAPDRVIALGTVSKSLAPALRLGWLVCPAAMVGAIAEQKAYGDRGSPVLDQLALANLLESGRFDRYLRRMRGTYARRRQTLVEALAEHAPRVTLTGLAAGFHAVAHLPAPAEEESVVARATLRSVGLYGMSRYRSTGAVRPAQLVLGFGNLSERAIVAGIAAVGDLLQGA